MLEKKPIEAADIEAHVVRSSAAALLLTVLVSLWAYWLLPTYVAMPNEPIDGLLIAIRLSIVPSSLLLIAVFLVSFARRQSATDGLGAAYSQPSQRVSFLRAYLQNTLEQTVLFMGVVFLTSTILLGDIYAVHYAATAIFALGRLTFYFGYRTHPLRRTFGMSLTLLPTIILLGFAIAALGLEFLAAAGLYPPA